MDNFQTQLEKLRASLQNGNVPSAQGTPKVPIPTLTLPPGVVRGPPPMPSNVSTSPVDIIKKYGKYLVLVAALAALLFYFIKKKQNNGEPKKLGLFNRISKTLGGGDNAPPPSIHPLPVPSPYLPVPPSLPPSPPSPHPKKQAKDPNFTLLNR